MSGRELQVLSGVICRDQIHHCRFCKNKSFHIVHSPSRTVWDIIRHKPTKYTYKIANLECSECGAVYEGYDPYAEDVVITDAFKNYLVNEILEAEGSLFDNYFATAKRCALEVTAVYDGVKDYIRHMHECIETCRPCNMIFFKPFTLDGVERCLVWGYNWADASERVLLDILPEYSKNAIQAFFISTPFDYPIEIKSAFCSDDDDIIDYLKSKALKVGILREQITEKLDFFMTCYLKNCGCDAFTALMDVFEYSNGENIKTNYADWCTNHKGHLPHYTAEAVQSWVDKYYDALITTFSYDKDALTCGFDRYLQNVESSIIYDALVYRMLFGQSEFRSMFRSICRSLYTKHYIDDDMRVYDFGVSFDALLNRLMKDI